MEDKTYRQVHQDIDSFLQLADGNTFSFAFIDREFNYKSREAKRYRWQVLKDYVKKGELEQVATDKFRKPQSEMEEVDWQNADVEDVVQVKWPMSLEKYIKLYHQSIAIIAGISGAGKTAFLEHFVLKNMGHPMGVTLFNNDMTPEEIKERMLGAGIPIPDPAPFKVYDRISGFGDVVNPNGINVIDYLDLNTDLYTIGDEIEGIYRKLKRGIALIGIQKKPGQELGIGGMFSIKRSKLYLSLDSVNDGNQKCHKLKIVKCRGRVNPKLNPAGMEFKFKLINGIKFWVIEEG